MAHGRFTRIAVICGQLGVGAAASRFDLSGEGLLWRFIRFNATSGQKELAVGRYDGSDSAYIVGYHGVDGSAVPVCVAVQLFTEDFRPTDLNSFLPWQMTPERREELAQPMPVTWLLLARPTPEQEEPAATDTS